MPPGINAQDFQRMYDRRGQDRQAFGFCFFDRHPQCSEGEVFLCNGTKEDFDAIELKTKRLGGVAYTFVGIQYQESKGLYSIFVQRSELHEHGIDCGLPSAPDPAPR